MHSSPLGPFITTLPEYINAWHDIRQALDQEFEEINKTPAEMTRFFSHASNKRRFLPNTPPDDDLTFYKDLIHIMHTRMFLDYRTDINVLLDQFKVSGDLRFLQDTGPFVFASFHLGPYGLIGYQLGKLGFDASVVITDGVQPEMLRQDNTENLDLKHIDSTNILADMMATLARGKSILSFVDGNLGVANRLNNRSFVPVPLLGDTFFCKKGTLLVAYMSNVPVIPIITYRNGPQESYMVIGSPIVPNLKQTRDSFAQYALERCYNLFERYLRRVPAQWEFWGRMSKYMASEQRNLAELPKEAFANICGLIDSQYRFNDRRYDFFKVQQTNYLYDRLTRDYFSISAGLAQLLTRYGQDASILRTHLPNPLLTDLLQRAVLTSV